MPESPDFDQIARRLAVSVLVDVPPPKPPETCMVRWEHIAEQLRQVWNARGAADLVAIDAAVAYNQDGLINGKRYQIERAVRTVDR